YVLWGLGITSALAIGLAFAGTISRAAAPESSRTEMRVVLSPTMPPPPDVKKEKVVIPPAPPPEMPPVKTMQFLPPDPVPDELADQSATMHSIDSLKMVKVFGTEDQDGDILSDLPIDFTEGQGEGVPDVIQDLIPKPGDFSSPDEEPKPINMKEISDLITYPQLMRDAGVEGTVVLRVLVDKSGYYKKHLVLNSPHPVLSREVESHINKLKFTPAIQGKRPIYFWVNIPFTFKQID
ncbi:MAG: energy transducer TonB, partial [Bacteroidota bacterium]